MCKTFLAKSGRLPDTFAEGMSICKVVRNDTGRGDWRTRELKALCCFHSENVPTTKAITTSITAAIFLTMMIRIRCVQGRCFHMTTIRHKATEIHTRKYSCFANKPYKQYDLDNLHLIKVSKFEIRIMALESKIKVESALLSSVRQVQSLL